MYHISVTYLSDTFPRWLC